MITIEKYPKESLAEIFQSLDIKFSFLNKINETTYKQIHTEVKCRDFLGDVLWSKATKRNVYIYGFKFNHDQADLDKEKLRVSLKFPDEKSKNNFINNIDKLNKLFKPCKTEPTIFIETDDTDYLIVEADPAWQSNIWKLSLFTFYLKVFSYKSTRSLKTPEDGYIKSLTLETKKKLFKQIKDKTEEFYYDTISMAHNYSGFYSIIKGKNEETYKILLGETSNV